MAAKLTLTSPEASYAMPRPCSVCNHPDRREIEAELVAARTSARALAPKFQLSSSALLRHKRSHIPAALAKAKEDVELLNAGALGEHVRELYARSAAVLAQAEASGDGRTALAAVRELRSILDLVARLATKDSTFVHVSTVRALLHGMFDVLHEFVPEAQTQAAIARLEALAHTYASNHASAEGKPEP